MFDLPSNNINININSNNNHHSAVALLLEEAINQAKSQQSIKFGFW